MRDEDFRWFANGQKLMVGEMDVQHLHHTVKFLENKMKTLIRAKRIIGNELNARRLEKTTK